MCGAPLVDPDERRQADELDERQQRDGDPTPLRLAATSRVMLDNDLRDRRGAATGAK